MNLGWVMRMMTTGRIYLLVISGDYKSLFCDASF